MDSTHRRVRVTARSRQTRVSSELETTTSVQRWQPRFTEIADPNRHGSQELHTECGWKQGESAAVDPDEEDARWRRVGRKRRADEGGSREGAKRVPTAGALPRTPPGGKPPETPAPFPWSLDCTERQRLVKGSQAAHKTRALDQSPPLRRVYL